MKKTALLCVLSLLLGCTAGLLMNIGALDGLGLLGPDVPAASPAGVTAAPMLPVERAFDAADNGPLLEAGNAVLKALKTGDIAALAGLTDPELGVTFTPYSTVDPNSDLTLTQQQLKAPDQDGSVYTWGLTDGRGSPIKLTITDYFAQYVFDADYTQASQIGVDQIMLSGNALENVAEAYPGCRFVDFSIPGQAVSSEGLDWSSLKLVFAPGDSCWYLVGVIHGEWTI